MATNSAILTEATKNLIEFKATMMAEIMRKRELDENTATDIGMLTLYLNTAVSNINGAQSLYDSLTAQPAETSAEPADETADSVQAEALGDEMARAETGVQAKAHDAGAED